MTQPDDFQPDNSENEIPEEELRFAPLSEDRTTSDDSFDSAEQDIVESEAETDDFASLTLAEVIGRFRKSPRETWRAFKQVTQDSRTSQQIEQYPIPDVEIETAQPPEPIEDVSQIEVVLPDEPSTVEQLEVASTRQPKPFPRANNRQAVRWILYFASFLIALLGSSILVDSPIRTENTALVAGTPYLIIAFLLWLGADIFGHWDSIQAWWATRNRLEKLQFELRLVPLSLIIMSVITFLQSFHAPADEVLSIVSRGVQWIALAVIAWVIVEIGLRLFQNRLMDEPEQKRQWLGDEDEIKSESAISENIVSSPPWWMAIPPSRFFFAGLAVMLSVITWTGTVGNFMSFTTFLIWLASVVAWSFVFAPFGWNIFDVIREKVEWVQRFNLRDNLGFVVAFVVIILLGAIFRLDNLAEFPPELTSDHLEKLLDSQRVVEGQYNIFFANNGGREPLQMYLMALFSHLPGQGINHDSLKLLAAIESLITLPFFFWMGKEVIGDRDRRLGIWVGLLMMGLVAVSYWHVTITRQALRIVLTPLVTSLLIIYLSRAMRHNKRCDFIKVGLILGFGLYTYQAVRMLPIVVVLGVGLAILLKANTNKERLCYVVNLVVVVWLSFMVFLPLFHYSVEEPEHFWLRTAGRILGDDVIQETLPDGRIVERHPSMQEQLDAFNANLPIITSNIRNALLLFNWKGDVGWISGVPNHPQMDRYAGALLIVGLAGWLMLGFRRRRDPVIWLIVPMIFIMLMPSALSIAQPFENPSATRTSGAIPPSFLIVAFALAVLAKGIVDLLKDRRGLAIAVGLSGFVILGSYTANRHLYFVGYPPYYISNSLPYSETGDVIREFALTNGSYSNVFMIAFPHWMGHREMGMAAGLTDWPNGIVALDHVPSFLYQSSLRRDFYQLDPDLPIRFLHSLDDEATDAQLREWFPEGIGWIVDSYQDGDDFRVFEVPALGEAQFTNFLYQELGDTIE